MANSVALKIRDLQKNFKNQKVLRGVNIDVYQGEIFSLLGSNGAGKTTLIKIIATLLQSDAGTIEFFGRNLENKPQEIKRQISLTGQFAAVDSLLSVEENLMMMARLMHVKKPKIKVASMLKRFNLTFYANKLTRKLSGGTKRRLDIAMSLISSPRILFLDEPTTGLDPQSRIALWEEIKRIVSLGTTVFLTSQYLDEVEYLSDHIAILHNGKIIKYGTKNELVNFIQDYRIIVTFESKEECKKAILRLLHKYVVQSVNECTISIVSTGAVKDVNVITKILTSFKVVSFEQTKISLEEIFMKLVGY